MDGRIVFSSNQRTYLFLGQDNIDDMLAGKWGDQSDILKNNIFCNPRPSPNADEEFI